MPFACHSNARAAPPRVVPRHVVPRRAASCRAAPCSDACCRHAEPSRHATLTHAAPRAALRFAPCRAEPRRTASSHAEQRDKPSRAYRRQSRAARPGGLMSCALSHKPKDIRTAPHRAAASSRAAQRQRRWRRFNLAAPGSHTCDTQHTWRERWLRVRCETAPLRRSQEWL